MKPTATLALAGLLLGSIACADGLPSVPKDYPSHSQAGRCYQDSLSARLQSYNEIRLQLADIVRHLADDPSVSLSARHRLLGYAENLDEMRHHLPPPNPDSSEFRNFDFRLGITLTAMTLFLNSEDEQLTRRFIHDRDDPQSDLGLYLARLEQSRQRYTDVLTASRNGDCNT